MHNAATITSQVGLLSGKRRIIIKAFFSVSLISSYERRSHPRLVCQSKSNFLKLKTDDVAYEYHKHLTSNHSVEWWYTDCYLLSSRTINSDHDWKLDQLFCDKKKIPNNSGLPDSTDWLTCDLYLSNWIHRTFVQQHFKYS